MVKLARFLPPVLAGAIITLQVATTVFEGPARTIAIVCVVLSLLASIFVRRAEMRAHATVAVACGAVAAAGQAQAHDTKYAFAAFLFALGALATLRTARLSFATSEKRAPANTRAWIVLALAGLAMTTLLVTQLPPLGKAVEHRIARRFGSRAADQTGIGSTIQIQTFLYMLQKDDVVMRVDGEAPDYLRGAVYDRYTMWHQWVASQRDQVNPLEEANAPFESKTTRLVLVSGAAGRGREARWFLPANACDLGTPSKVVTIDPDLVAHPEPWWTAETIWFRTKNCKTKLPDAGEPRPEHKEVSPRIADKLKPIAREWTQGATTDREKLEAIERKLKTFEYTLKYEGDSSIDPVIYFLTVRHSGHCGLFASAMALLGRSAGIPTRMVAGYHGGEPNSLDGHVVIRERDAHAWVEAWVDGQWRAFDPTPVADAPPPKPSFLKELGEWLTYSFDRSLIALARLELVDLLVVLVGVVLFLFLVRAIQQRLAKRRKKTSEDFTRPLPCLVALTDALAKRGWEREPSEPLERFARRIAALEEPWSEKAAAALVAYASLRYGSGADESKIIPAVEAAAKLTRA